MCLQCSAYMNALLCAIVTALDHQPPAQEVRSKLSSPLSVSVVESTSRDKTQALVPVVTIRSSTFLCHNKDHIRLPPINLTLKNLEIMRSLGVCRSIAQFLSKSPLYDDNLTPQMRLRWHICDIESNKYQSVVTGGYVLD